MTDKPAPADVKWVIALRDREEQVVVEAVTVANSHGMETVRSAGDVALTTLHNAAGDLVFQAPTLGIAYLRRFGPPEHVIQPGPRNRGEARAHPA